MIFTIKFKYGIIFSIRENIFWTGGVILLIIESSMNFNDAKNEEKKNVISEKTIANYGSNKQKKT